MICRADDHAAPATLGRCKLRCCIMALDPRIASRLTRYRREASRFLARASERLEVAPPAWQLRNRVGGRWEEIGLQQFDFMLAEGLQPAHAFIDVGCGVLRGGLHYINFLDPGKYFGIDISADMISGAEAELTAAGLAAKHPTLRVTETFDVDFTGDFTGGFDRGIALSVFTHVPWNSCYRALANLAPAMAPGGRFYATFFPGPDGP